MTTIHPSALAAKVAAQNHVHALARDAYAPIVAALRPFVGTKVQNASGELSKRVRDRLRTVTATSHTAPGSPWIHMAATGHSVIARFKVCHSAKTRGSEIAHYGEVTIYVADLDAQGTLLRLTDAPTGLRTDVTTTEVENARRDVTAARAALSAAQARLYSFGEYDR